MARLLVKACLRLAPTEAGGRRSPILSDYRPTFDVGAQWQGRTAMSDGRVTLIDLTELPPGGEAVVHIEPLWPEFWATVGIGVRLPVHEGSRVIGHATIVDVVFGSGFSAAVAWFVREAREFVAFVEEAARLPLKDRVARAHRHLPSLYAAALGLPLPEVSWGATAPWTPEAPAGWQGFDEFETYWEIFDPYELGDATAGSLSDDLLDIYRDLRRGLHLWNSPRDRDSEALWEWRFSFDSHWGRHAVDALRALHRAYGRGTD